MLTGQLNNKIYMEYTQIRQIRQDSDVPNAPNPHITTRARALSHCPLESEKVLETKLRKAIESRGGMCLKLLSQLHRGLPDRLILMPRGLTYFAEIKTTGKRPTKLQDYCHRQLESLTFPVFVIDSTTSLEETLAVIDAEAK